MLFSMPFMSLLTYLISNNHKWGQQVKYNENNKNKTAAGLDNVKSGTNNSDTTYLKLPNFKSTIFCFHGTGWEY